MGFKARGVCGELVPRVSNVGTAACFRVRALLTEAQGLTAGGEHPLPWYPPVCVPLMDLPEGSENTYDHLKSVSYAERSRIPLKYNDPSMRQVGCFLIWLFTAR